MQKVHYRLVWRPNLNRYLAEFTIGSRRFTQKLTDYELEHWIKSLQADKNNICLGYLRLNGSRVSRLQIAEYMELVKSGRDKTQSI